MQGQPITYRAAPMTSVWISGCESSHRLLNSIEDSGAH